MLQSQEQTTFVFIVCIDTVGDAWLLYFQCEFSQKQKHVNIVNDIRKEVDFLQFSGYMQAEHDDAS